MRTFYSLWTFLAGIATSTISEGSSAAGVTIDGVLLKDSQVTTDTILEKTATAGVTADGVLLKDGGIETTGKIKMGAFEIHSGPGVPNGDLAGAVTTTRAIYFRTDGASGDEIAYFTVNTGTNWAAGILAS